MVKTSNVALMVLMAFIVGFILGAVTIKKYRPCINIPVETIVRDTTIIRDTVPGEVPPPKTQQVIRHDTVRIELQPENDTAIIKGTNVPDTTKPVSDSPRMGQNGDLIIPISQKVYTTQDYSAWVSGWRPSLDSIKLYRKTQVINNTVTKYRPPRWALTAGGGVGTTGGKVAGFVGISLGYVLWSK